ncbi:hypothetical protein MCUN1_003755 [Malassezia cuniculi]|uniref:Major facilitator superfamily (MFS) profile domain-containing protein n=1 Tax=Malassezia cuniculi TaxID=948313 RepID=A0AAF0EU53_9BASI|nr:hypothetical protein MCUN1_003755 [Malassezia cuniculi]
MQSEPAVEAQHTRFAKEHVDAEHAPRDIGDAESVDSHVMLARELGLSVQYERQAALINKAIKEEIGFGPFQIKLSLLAGFGWFADNIWFGALSVSLTRFRREFGEQHVGMATFALYVGLLFGSTFWGFASDVIGRRPSWNITLFLTAVFAIAVGGAPSFAAAAILVGCLGLGLGGNLPVDGAVLIEFLPGTHQWIVTFLSFFWCIGQLFASLIGWAFIPNFSCPDEGPCPRSENMGWRYMWFLLGGVTLIMWFVRFFVYPIPESPKYLLAMKREEEAMEVLQFIAKENGKTTSLTLEKLHEVGLGRTEVLAEPAAVDAVDIEKKEDLAQTHTRSSRRFIKPKVTDWGASMSPRRIREALSVMHQSPISALFASRKMALNTVLICMCWGAVGLAYPLFNSFIAIYLEQKSNVSSTPTSISEQYRQLVIIAVCGVPGSLFASAMVELPYAGRRGSMAIFTCLTGVFLFLFTTAKSSDAVLGWSCAVSLVQNAMYAILYAITYEVFPAPQRGTGDGLAMSTQRVFGIAAPLIATFASKDEPNTPIYVSGAMFLVASIVMVFLPYEPRGHDAL